VLKLCNGGGLACACPLLLRPPHESSHNMVVLSQTKSSSLSEASYSHVGGIKSESLASQRYPCTQQAEMMAWKSVGRRIATVFVLAADEDKVDELKKEALCHPYCADNADCSNMCSPAPSSVFPTDVSTTAGTVAAALSEVASDSGNDTDYDFFSEHDDDCDSIDFDRPDGFQGMDKSFEGLDESFKGMDMTFSGMEAAFKSLHETPAESRENWQRVGQRLAGCFDDSDEEEAGEQVPCKEGAFFGLQQVV